jgi:hypothetical protein
VNRQILIVIVFLLIAGNVVAEDRPWKTGSFEHEGFPLLLRVPDGLNYDELKEIYPQFISVTHYLSKVKNNGLPEADYNESLYDFDEQLVGALENTGAGITVLVETFGGERTYYMYSKSDFSSELLEKELNKTFPEHQIEINSKTDKEWFFIKQYAND